MLSKYYPDAVHPNAIFPIRCVVIMPTLLRRQQSFHMLLLYRELSLHNPFTGHSLNLLNQTPSSVQSLDVVTATNTPAADKYIGNRPPSSAFRKCSL